MEEVELEEVNQEVSEEEEAEQTLPKKKNKKEKKARSPRKKPKPEVDPKADPAFSKPHLDLQGSDKGDEIDEEEEARKIEAEISPD